MEVDGLYEIEGTFQQRTIAVKLRRYLNFEKRHDGHSNLKALTDIDRAIKLDPANWRLYNSRALIRSMRGELDEAEADYTRAIGLHPSSMTFSIRGGFYDFSRKDTRKAIVDYTEAIRLAEQEKAKTGYSEFPPVILYRDRARLYEKLGEPDKAKADFEKAR